MWREIVELDFFFIQHVGWKVPDRDRGRTVTSLTRRGSWNNMTASLVYEITIKKLMCGS